MAASEASSATRWRGIVLAKSEVAFFGTRQRLLRSNLPANLSVAGSKVVVSDVLKILGVTFDSTLTYNKHVDSVVRSCNFHIKALRHLRPYLTLDVAKTMAASIVAHVWITATLCCTAPHSPQVAKSPEQCCTCRLQRRTPTGSLT